MTRRSGVAMPRIGFWLSGLCVLAWIWAGPASAETRVALVIGNAAYAHAPRLGNPVNDSTLVAAALRSVGFTTVQLKRDLGKAALEASLRDFARTAAAADVAVVYYAGHGMEAGGTNYLVPVDATLADDSAVDFETVPLDLVLRSVEGARRLKLVVLDACRNNPFAVTMKRLTGTRAIGRGLARVEPNGDTLVAYAAREGSTADDGGGADSPFATALSNRIRTPGLELRLMFGKVRDDVVLATARKQEPAIYGSLGGEAFYFVPDANAAAAGQGAAPAAPDARAAELSLWSTVADSNDADQLNVYLQQYPNGMFAAVAKAKIASARANTQQASFTSAASVGLQPTSALSPQEMRRAFLGTWRMIGDGGRIAMLTFSGSDEVGAPIKGDSNGEVFKTVSIVGTHLKASFSRFLVGSLDWDVNLTSLGHVDVTVRVSGDTHGYSATKVE